MGFANGCIVSDGSVIIRAAVSSLVCVAAITVIMGLVRQVPSTHPSADVIGFSKMLSFGPFVLLYVWLVAVLGMTILRAAIPFNVRKIPFLLNHAGLFVALLTATLGNADMQRLKMLPNWARPNGVP